jgi:hypothetical protein
LLKQTDVLRNKAERILKEGSETLEKAKPFSLPCNKIKPYNKNRSRQIW